MKRVEWEGIRGGSTTLCRVAVVGGDDTNRCLHAVAKQRTMPRKIDLHSSSPPPYLCGGRACPLSRKVVSNTSSENAGIVPCSGHWVLMLRVLYAVRMARSSYPSKERVFFFCFFLNFELNFFYNGNKELPRATYLRSVSSPNLTSESIGVCINLLSAKCIRGLVASQYLKFFPYPPYKLYNTASGDDCCFVTVLSVWRQT